MGRLFQIPPPLRFLHFCAANRDEAAGIENGAMAFDLQQIRPLFRLEIGRPGSSFAFEIARKIGLPEEIIRAAEAKIGSAQANAEKHIREAARDKRYWESKRERIRQAEKHIDRTAAQYELQLSEIQSDKSKILQEARAEAERLLAEANRRIEQTIREIRESQAERERTRTVRAEFDAFRNRLAGSDTQPLPSDKEDPILRKMKQLREREQRRKEKRAKRGSAAADDPSTVKQPEKPREIEPGFHVRIRGQQAVGEVLSLQGSDKATVAFGHMTTVVDRTRLEIVPHAEFKKLHRNSTTAPFGSGPTTHTETYDTSRKRLNFKQQLDVRGLRAAEALAVVETFVDEAIVLGIAQVTILHGKGTGALKEEIRRYLRTVPLVLSAEDEHEEFGGAGITVVRLDV